MIKIEDINALIEQETEKLKPDADRELQLQQQINDKIAEISLSVDDGNVKEAERLRGEIKDLKEELSQVEDLNQSKESGAYAATLLAQGKLGKKVKEYEQQQFQIAEGMLLDEEKLAAKVTKAAESLIAAIKDMRVKRQEIAELLQPLDYLQQYMTNPEYYPNGHAYEAVKRKMTDFNFTSMADKVKHAGGVLY